MRVGGPGDDLTKHFPLIVDASAFGPGLRSNEWIDGGENDGATLFFFHACQLGLEGIVSKRNDSPYRSGRSTHWLKMKRPALRSGEAGRSGDPP